MTAARPKCDSRRLGSKSSARDNTRAGPFVKFDNFRWHSNFFSVDLLISNPAPAIAAATRRKACAFPFGGRSYPRRIYSQLAFP
jgi:hypothetical protein